MLYIAKEGTPHVVRETTRIREFTKGESMENTAPIIQVVLQRQKELKFDNGESYWTADRDCDPFCMQECTFAECYEEIKR